MTTKTTAQPPWLAEAWALLGAREQPGAESNARITALYRDAGHPGVRSDETAWCAAFTGACLERAGIRSTRSLMARSYQAWGQPVDGFRLGAIAVLSRTANPSLGHVGFLVGERDGHVVLLGGNQGDAVSVAVFPRSRLLSLRWPVSEERDEPGAVDAFSAALEHVLEMEGGYADDPADPGGPTYRGITLATFASWRGVTLDQRSRAGLVQQLRKLDAGEIANIYRQRYWTPSASGTLPAGVELMHFDAAVNQGVPTAVRMLQEAADADVDGEIGPLTRAAIAQCVPGELIERYAAIRNRRYRALPHFPRFGRGWLARLETTRRRALARAALDFHPPTEGETTMLPSDATQPKWWGHSLTIWGTLVTALATVLPAIGPLIGIELTADLVRQLGSEAVTAAQAIVGLAGTVMAIYGRFRATAPLARREVNLRL